MPTWIASSLVLLAMTEKGGVRTFASPRKRREGVRKRDGITIAGLKYVHCSRNLIWSRRPQAPTKDKRAP
jgi:hypothetical protein